ncbi:hypothetical protein EJ06DRAFT_522795 [Trichodelitschia bisporula]|uniref:Uncharacterized protein n=1 Tax=Trichodelitschia bisporula TaxID=703511 RepID=A0A6G1HTV0_9PEZI|nr:hypothetical protein EJ06DRAFT_522795 [Trichodelitschia bisporula]
MALLRRFVNNAELVERQLAARSANGDIASPWSSLVYTAFPDLAPDLIPTSTAGFGNIAPLTTSFTPPAACATQYAAPNRDINSVGAGNFVVGRTSSCYPPGFVSISFYSPGICPSGQTLAKTAQSTTVHGGTSTAVQFAGFCCYTGFAVEGLLGTSQCVSRSTSPFTISAEYSLFTTSTGLLENTIFYASTETDHLSDAVLASTSFAPHSTTYSATGLTTAVTGTSAIFIAAPVQIRWEHTDSAIMHWALAGDPIPPGALSPSTRKSVPPGAIAGAVIGALLVLALLIILVFLFLHRRRARTPPYSPTNSNQDYEFKTNTSTTVRHLSTRELDAAPVNHELDGRMLSPREYALQTRAREEQPAWSPRAPPPPLAPLVIAPPGPPPPPPREPSVPPEPPLRGVSRSSARSPLPRPSHARHASDATSPTSPATSTSTEVLSMAAQRERIRAERARLTRLQELEEMEARLEEQMRSEEGFRG